MFRWIILIFTTIAPVASAWDDGGHLLVNEIAARRLHPKVAARANALLELLDRRYNGNRAYNLVTAGTFMDDLRAMPGYAWSKWHYIDLECEESPALNPGEFREPAPPHVRNPL